MIIKTYEGFWEKPIDNIQSGIKNFFKDFGKNTPTRLAIEFLEKTSFSDVNYIICNITDELGTNVEYYLNCSYGVFTLREKNDKFFVDQSYHPQKSHEWLLKRFEQSDADHAFFEVFFPNPPKIDTTKFESIVDGALHLKDFIGNNYRLDMNVSRRERMGVVIQYIIYQGHANEGG